MIMELVNQQQTLMAANPNSYQELLCTALVVSDVRRHQAFSSARALKRYKPKSMMLLFNILFAFRYCTRYISITQTVNGILRFFLQFMCIFTIFYACPLIIPSI